MKLLTRDLPNGIFRVSDRLGLSTVAHPEVPDGLDAMSSDALRAILADTVPPPTRRIGEPTALCPLLAYSALPAR